MKIQQQFRTWLIALFLLMSGSYMASAACTASFTMTPDSSGQGYYFTNTSAGTWTNVQWSFGDGSSSTAPAPYHMYSSNGYYMVTLTIWNSNGSCQATAYDTASVTGFPPGCQAYFTYSLQTSHLTVYSSSSGVNSSTHYTWSFGDGTSGTSSQATHTYTASGTYQVCLTISDSSTGCFDNYCTSVVVNVPSSGCSAAFTQSIQNLTVNCTGSASGIYQYWSFGDGSQSGLANPSHTYSSAGTYQVCHYVVDSANNCSDQVCHTITVTSPTTTCTASFQAYDSSGVWYFMPTPYSSNLDYYWSFGDGNSSSNAYPTHVYNTTGWVNACLTVIDSTNMCSAVYCDSLYLGGSTPTCTAAFTWNVTTGTSIHFTNGSNTSAASASYLWTFGDGTSSNLANPTHTYSTTGTKNVCLTMTTPGGCSSSVCHTVTVTAANCSADFSYYTDSTDVTNFWPLTANSANSYTWTFGDGTSGTGLYPHHTYAQSGTYIVCLNVTNQNTGCYAYNCDTVVVTVSSSTPCNASFNAYPDSTSNIVWFANTSTGSYTNMSWSFGDGTASTSANPAHTYTTAGTYYVCLTVWNNSGCQSSYCDTVVAGGNPSGNQCVPQFVSYPDSTIGSGTVYFQILNPCSGTQYVWSVNGINLASGITPVITFVDSGWYYVCVTGYTSSGTFVTCDSVYANRMGNFTGLNDAPQVSALSVAPNPANDIINVSATLSKSTAVEIEIMSLEGRVLSTETSSLNAGIQKMTLDVHNLTSGMYLLRLRSGDQQQLTRFVVQR